MYGHHIKIPKILCVVPFCVIWRKDSTTDKVESLTIVITNDTYKATVPNQEEIPTNEE